MRFRVLIVAFALLAGCVGAPRVRTEVSIPSLEAEAVGVDDAYTAGWQRLRSGDTRQAMDMFRRSRADEDRLYVAFGFVYLVRGNLDLARKNFQDALTLNRDSASARLGMAEFHRNQGDMREAFRIYSRLRNEFPDNPWVRLRHEQIRSRETEKWLRAAERLEQTGNMDADYRDALEKALYYSPDLVELKQRLAEYLEKREEGDQAVEVYRDIVD
ncbi:MAG: tetratricopeptide repeat protein, partial [Candidatus Aminicenantes bacterium]|nr:tetratricopeptide repeat protein [Candidatus Aminicenantes bacterium]